jgi:hypothetical protein
MLSNGTIDSWPPPEKANALLVTGTKADKSKIKKHTNKAVMLLKTNKTDF